ncbi:DMT family transporter [Mucilaginibacter sp. BJC16-A38]|uniref:DMT family transporter n=1 Tax=Mucilaginibacter phenanthrenivorans TaxID=1234842 RepID=UPI0021581535|nr:DMT family transporter [Mucilaginibacter phenanthrenivorans]MCR8560113.1 DMT family transporter [Mucilaginibacter phenanthrenivorans]
MSFYVLSLVLTAAVLHAFWNLLAKKANGKAPFIWLMYIVSTILYLPLLLYSVGQGDNIFSQPVLWLSLSSAILHMAYFLILQKGYRSGDLSVVYPLARGTGPLFSSLAAILLLHEQLKLKATIGLFLILIGVLVITGLSFKKANNAKIMTGVFWGVLTGLFIALYTFNDTVAIKTYAVSPVIITFVSSVFSIILLFPFVCSQGDEIKREIKQHKWSIIAIGLLSPAAYILVLEALKYAPLTVVAPARETSILLGVFMGSRALNEKDGKRRLIASALILGGIVALGLS